MKVCIIQPEYSVDYSRSDELFEKEIELLEQCDSSMDMIVMPESSDIPCLAKTVEQNQLSVSKYNEKILEKAKETACRCNAIVFINARYRAEGGDRNTTYAINRNGEVIGTYFKEHLTPGEVRSPLIDSDYSFEYTEPTVVEIEGVRYAFLTCYDFYFYENFANIARCNVDVVIGCSHQRSDTHQALQIMSQFLAYNTNAYVIRSSVSMDENSDIGGASMVVAPDGTVLANMYSRIGMETVEIDVKKKYFKPAGFGNPDAAHYEYIETGRRPMKYRPAGSAIVKNDEIMPYPRICAHRGFNTIAPENSMPAFGAAIAMGAEEIEFDIWQTKDGEIISIHDLSMERVSDGYGELTDLTYKEMLKFDFGVKYGEKFKGMKILRFEDILKKFSCQVIMNIHIKPWEEKVGLTDEFLKKIIALIYKYDCQKHVYFMSGVDIVLEKLRDFAPDICRCCGGGFTDESKWAIVDRAIKYDCKKVQLVKEAFNQELIDKAHANGIKCNIFWSDEAEETKAFIEMGIDTILTNDYNLISQVVKETKC